jgi:hypothetical protein
MKLSVLLICLGFLSGCYSIQQTTNNHAPVLLVQHPFPYVPISIYRPDCFLTTDIFILEDGSVSDVKLQTNSGYKEWDSVVVATIMTWEYSPMKVGDKPVSCWVHQKMRVKIDDPVIYSLSALLFPSYEVADSVYNDLVVGRKFEEIAQSISLLPMLGKHIEIGEVDIHQYSESIRSNLVSLSEGEFTRPIKYDDHYIIFKRDKKL